MTIDAPFDEQFKRQLATIRAAERTRHFARAELSDEIIAEGAELIGLRADQVSDLWRSTIKALLKQGLEDEGVNLILRALGGVTRQE